MKKLKPVCTWGEGPDILLVNKGKPYLLYDSPSMKDRYKNGISTKGDIELNLKEAIELRNSLDMSIANVKELERSIRSYFENEYDEEIEVVFFEENGTWVAQALQYDIASQGNTLEKAIKSFEKTIIGQIYLDINHDILPLSDTPKLQCDKNHFEKIADKKMIFKYRVIGDVEFEFK